MELNKIYPIVDRNREFIKSVSNRNNHYFIPPELVINEYDTYDIQVTKLDGGWIAGRAFDRVSQIVTGYNKQEWYDICILGLKSPLDRPRCSQCGESLPFRRLDTGYGSYYEGKYIFCSNACSAEFKNSHPEEYPDYNEIYKAGGGFGLIHSHPEIYEEGAKALVTNGWGTNGFYSSLKGPSSCPYRSQLELDYMELLDSDPQILSWLYEPFSINYSNADGFP